MARVLVFVDSERQTNDPREPFLSRISGLSEHFSNRQIQIRLIVCDGRPVELIDRFDYLKIRHDESQRDKDGQKQQFVVRVARLSCPESRAARFRYRVVYLGPEKGFSVTCRRPQERVGRQEPCCWQSPSFENRRISRAKNV